MAEQTKCPEVRIVATEWPHRENGLPWGVWVRAWPLNSEQTERNFYIFVHPSRFEKP